MKSKIKDLIKNLTLLVISVVIILTLFEIFLRLFKPQIFEVHPKGMYAANPVVGYILAPGFKGVIEREEFKQYFKVNSTSFRGSEIRAKENDTYRILILGDSYAFGFGVKENETFGSYLQQCLSHKSKKKIEVLNGGVPGYGTIDQLNLLKLCGDEIKPDVIIVQFLSVNDFVENRTPSAEWAVVKDGYLTSKTNSTEREYSFKDITDWLKSHLHSAKFISERLGYLAMKYNLIGSIESFWGEDFTKEDEKLTGSAFHDLIKYADKINAEVLLLYTVGQGQVISKKQTELASEKFIKSIAESENIKWINTLREMRKRSDRNDFYFPIDGHWTPKGHLAVAEMICSRFPEYNSTVLSVK